jgi:hypothetical protein
LIAVLTACFWLRGEQFIAANGPTFDEGVHLTAGYAYWTTGDFRLNEEHPPLMKLLWALPAVLEGGRPAPPLLSSETNHWQIADAWLYGSGESPRRLVASARRVNLAFGCGVVLLVSWWAFRLWGLRLAALAAGGFAACDPTLLALSCILSTDLGLAFFALLTCYLAWEYVRAPSQTLLLGVSISLGLMLATKFSAVGIVAGLSAAASVHLARGGILALPNEQNARGVRPALDLAMRVGVIAAVSVAATYGFIHVGDWGAGLKFQLTRRLHGDGEMYLNGAISRSGWYHYFLFALLYKLPLGLLAAVAVRAAMALRQCESVARNLWLELPPVVFFALASLSRVDIGVRVVLPVLPFLYLLAAGLAVSGSLRLLRLAVLFTCLLACGWVAVSVSPHEIGYMNELAPSRAREAPSLADSNLDWGQGLPALKAWMDSAGVESIHLAYFGTDHPEAYGIRYRRLPGYGQVWPAPVEPGPESEGRVVVAVSSNHLYGLFLNNPTAYTWLRSRQPATTLDGSIRVFDLTGDAAAIARLRTLATSTH